MRLLLLSFLPLFFWLNTYGQAPTISCPANISANTAAGQCHAVVTYSNPTCTSNCTDAVITQTDGTGLTSGNQFPIGTTTLEYTITGPDGSNSCSFTITVTDNENPVITCPSDLNLTAPNGQCSRVVNFSEPDATDNCGNVTITQVDATGLSSGSTFPLGSTTLKFRATDQAGNFSECEFTINVRENNPPSITSCPGSQNLAANANCEALLPDYRDVVTVSDACDPNPAVTQTPAPGTLITALGVDFTVTITATDNFNNSASCSFQTRLVDETAPVISSCPGNQLLFGDANCEVVLPSFTALISATDNCDNNLTKTQSPAAGATVGNNATVTLTVTDDFGNQASCSFTVLIFDGVAPEITCPDDQNLSLESGCSVLLPDYRSLADVFDACDPNPTITQSPAPGTSLSGVGTEQVVTITARDANNNTASCSFTVTLVDDVAPDLTCPGNQEINIDQDCAYTLPDYTGLVFVVDNCDTDPVVTQSPAVGTVLTGATEITITASDNFSNKSVCTFTVIPNDNVPPVIVCPDDYTTCESMVVFSDATATDNCGEVTVVRTDSNTDLVSGVIFPLGTTTLTYTAEDIAGNTATCSFDITVFEAATLETTTEIELSEGESAQLNVESNGDTFLWTPATGLSSSTVSNPTVTAQNNITYTVTATTADGCSKSETVRIEVNKVDLIINNIITPNNDGKNDTWDVNKLAMIEGCKVRIFNRWGNEVWESDNYNNNWTGVNKSGNPLPDGTYYYTIDCKEQDVMYKGSISLMRLQK
jgi:gliding motility-associated-like protein